MKIVSIVGARPEFVQGAPVSRALRERGHHEVLVHTGQHYDYKMSQTFFDELGIPAPDHNLEVGSGAQGRQTGEMLGRLEAVLLQERPDAVIVRGDTNSTVAGALAAAKLHLPIAHVEAGERSFDRHMPEEINRVITDSISDLFFCVSQTAVRQLAAEGIGEGVFWTGDVMLDANLHNRPIARRHSDILARLGLTAQGYALATVHRAANTDDPARLANIVAALNRAPEPVIFPVHPRTRQALGRLGAAFAEHVRLIEPVGYFDMMVLEEHARLIATDSGGVQREAYFFGVPCLTLRDETEWTETVTAGWNVLAGNDPAHIAALWISHRPPAERPPIFGDGTAAQQIVRHLEAAQPLAFGRTRRRSALAAGGGAA
ncbi:MAG: UDP-N-acetylglucosamine 2-epimerase (non-hydrolyzing) [Anaerolineales bacterium]|nr:UDP-N-acetylglucosamine 2-epimerase (non-hydrolyzing) [Anaerolineales bacterium]